MRYRAPCVVLSCVAAPDSKFKPFVVIPVVCFIVTVARSAISEGVDAAVGNYIFRRVWVPGKIPPTFSISILETFPRFPPFSPNRKLHAEFLGMLRKM